MGDRCLYKQFSLPSVRGASLERAFSAVKFILFGSELILCVWSPARGSRIAMLLRTLQLGRHGVCAAQSNPGVFAVNSKQSLLKIVCWNSKHSSPGTVSQVVFTIKSQPHRPATNASCLPGGGKAATAGTPASHTTAPLHLKAAGNLQIWIIRLHDLASSQKQSPEVSPTDSDGRRPVLWNHLHEDAQEITSFKRGQKAFTRIKEKKGGKNF